MKKKIFGLVLSVILTIEIVVPVWATTISGVRNQRNQTQQNLNQVNSEIGNIQSQRDTAYSEYEEMNNELVDILTSIGILEEEIGLKQKEINMVQSKLTKAQKIETDQYESMKKRIKFMYEEGNMVYMQALLGAINYADMVNKAEYVEGIYNYDRKLLAEYVQNREEIESLKTTLEEEQSQMCTAEYELRQERDSLEMLVALKRRTVEDFDIQLDDAKKKAAAYQQQLKQQTERIKKLEEKERKKREAAEKKKKEKEEKEQQQQQEEDEDGDGSITVNVNTGEKEGSGNNEDSGNDSGEEGSEEQYEEEYDEFDESESYDESDPLGQQICDYACQFVGNPYVFGGTSLTNGADCSGFTQAVFAHFGISIPRDSYSQRSCGVAVAYEDAQPGDIICYAGHVALYIGDGQIVHASTERTGITYGYATYRTILAVRRVI
ncbi:MAG: C40 family peptidase [Lachnospiraceae bacterium]|nr:C40 family peptidase [Lachnospiraceae bacterium]